MSYGVRIDVHHDFHIHAKRERYFSLKQFAHARAMADQKNARTGGQCNPEPRDKFRIVRPDCIRLNEADKVEVTVFGIKDMAHSDDVKKKDQHLLEVSFSVPADAIASGEHIDIATRKMHEKFDVFPDVVFDEHSPAGAVIMNLRRKLESLINERATMMVTPRDTQNQPYQLEI